MGDRRVIHDPIHGGIYLEGVFLDLMDRHEMQRLRAVKQLGMGSFVFPGANHTRFEHSLGAYYLAGRISDVLGLSKQDRLEVTAAALLHDICHPPFSHTTEDIMEGEMGTDHMVSAAKLIKGEIENCREEDRDVLGNVGPIAEVLEDSGISSERVCNLISMPRSSGDGRSRIFAQDGDSQSFFDSENYAHQIIHGPVDADQMDYLSRDAHYTGVALGRIDMERLMSQMALFNHNVVIRKGGIYAAEGLMVSRALMYSSVYYHKTVRIAELMLVKAAALSGLDFSDIHLINDCEFMRRLVRCDSQAASRLARLVSHRRFYKNAYVRRSHDLAEGQAASLVKYSNPAARAALESEIAERAGVDEHTVLVDVPPKSTLLSNSKVGKTDVSILDDDRVRPITRYSPLAKALQNREIFDWVIVVSTDPSQRERVGEAASRILSLDDA